MASLNKDLFGKIPVTPVTTTPVEMGKKPEKPRRVDLDADVYHGSNRSVEDFTKAPVIHVGTASQAAHRINNFWRNSGAYSDPAEVEGVHGFNFSEHAQIHPTVFPDDVANEAHALFLEARGHAVPHSVRESGLGSYVGTRRTSPLADEAVQALNENKIIQYNNVAEGRYPYEPKTDSNISYVVPTPYLNLKQFGEKEKWEQQPLPMDYTDTVPQSKLTVERRLPPELRATEAHLNAI